MSGERWRQEKESKRVHINIIAQKEGEGEGEGGDGEEKERVHIIIGELAIGEVGVRGANPHGTITTFPRRESLKNGRDRLHRLGGGKVKGEGRRRGEGGEKEKEGSEGQRGSVGVGMGVGEDLIHLPVSDTRGGRVSDGDISGTNGNGIHGAFIINRLVFRDRRSIIASYE